MLHAVPRTVPMVVALFACVHALAPAEDKPTTETAKIEALIKHVEGLPAEKFVRNGSEYDAKSAAKFLRGKWDTNHKSISTARDFIDKVATASGTTGKPYLIRFKDGREVKSGEYLTAELKKLE